ncbi:phosphoribosylglycinamide formyltransferase [Altererythrobacter lutimaris]|uniref:Phosphoribosylglycinamide formyltransferase n=1 Tax=Altererythrobacter lutimaris TaxID=2743979 RepID=A0A850H741_9SPHN|nr:phosphoribosylglycinamide formyltransferase [Altererythrobacter lutimaris]NVE93579.1 phosphoribosylglycinamide formyltransferase [Altererythrobacter lutimaris]
MPDSKAKVAIFISGGGTNMAALLYASRLDNAPYEVVLVASNRPEAGGLELARTEGITTFAHSHKGMSREEHDAIMEQAVRDADAEYIVLAGYMRILSDAFVERWHGAMLNIHPSLLPKYKGLETHHRAIDAGDSHGGASVHLVTPELDAGEVLGQIKVAIRDGDTADALAERVKVAEHQLYPRVVADYVSRSSNPDFLLEQVRRRAMQLPEVEERASHGAPGWRTAGKSGKYFAYFSDRHHGESATALLVKTSGADEQAALIEGDPERFYSPKFYGPSGWIGIVLNAPGLDWEQVDYWLARSWRSVAPKRLTKLQDAADMF